MSHSQEDFQRLNKLFQILVQTLGFSKDIAEALITKYQRDYQSLCHHIINIDALFIT
jgi:hypothetical protein